MVSYADARPIAAIEVRVARFAWRHAAFGSARADPGRPARRTATPIGLTQTIVGPIIAEAGNGAGTGGETTSACAGAAAIVACAGCAIGRTDRGACSGLAGLAILALAIGAAVDEAEVSVLVEMLLDRALGDLNAMIGAVPCTVTDGDLLALARRAHTMPGISAPGGGLAETNPGEPRQDAEQSAPGRAICQGAQEMIEEGIVHKAPPFRLTGPPRLIALRSL